METPDENDDFLRRIEREFAGERWFEAFAVMHHAFGEYYSKHGVERAMEIFQIARALDIGSTPTRTDEEADLARLIVAWAQTAAEAAMMGVAYYITTREPPTPTEQS